MDKKKDYTITSDAEFDTFLRDRAVSESVTPPDGFEERMEAILKRLPQQIGGNEMSTEKGNCATNEINREREAFEPATGRKGTKGIKRTRRTKRLIAAVAALAVLGTITATAAPVVMPMAGSAISYFNAPKEFKYLSEKAAFEEFNAAAGISTEDQGIKLTVDNIAVSDNYINVFYTIASQEPIVLRGDESTPEDWITAWAAPDFWFKADGVYIQPAAQGEVEAWLQDEYTLTGMQRFAVMSKLPDTFNLELYTSEMLDKTGDWHVALGIDKSAVAVETLTIEPNQKLKVNAANGKHTVTVDKISLSPFGSQLVLKERTSKVPFSDFVLRDDKGAWLPVIPAALQGHPFFTVANHFEFMGANTDTKSITIIPWRQLDGTAKTELIPLDQAEGANMAVTNLGGFTINEVKLEDGMLTVTATPYGACEATLDINLADKDGEYLNYLTASENRYDREKGTVTLVGWLDSKLTDKDLAKITSLKYFTRTAELYEDQAVVIDLQ